MADQPLNDNLAAVPGLQEPDAHGQAAMLLVESLIHGLIANSVMTVEQAVEVVDIATEVKAEIALDLGDTQVTSKKSLSLLGAIASSLRSDLPRG